jgi:asparagine synthase (glutamine-hydrolysing)
LGNSSKKISPEDFKEIQYNEPESTIEHDIRDTIRNEVGEDLDKIGISLSSGIDSTLVLALLRKEFPSIKIESISVKFSQSIDETDASKKISDKFDTNHHVLEIDNFLEELPQAINIVKQPFWDLHWYYLVKKMKELTPVFLSGDGGDELFGGYTFRYNKFLELINDNSTTEEKVISYLNCHERDWVPDQELIFGDECKFNWEEIYNILRPYFNNSLSNLNQVLLADHNGKLLHNMQPLYSLIHKHFGVTNITPIQNDETIRFSSKLAASKKYLFSTNTGKIPLVDLIEKYGLTNMISQKKQGFSVNTVNMWNSYGHKICKYYLDDARISDAKIINQEWIEKYINQEDLDVRIVNKFLGLLALEIWYRLFISKEITPSEKLQN